MRLGYLYFLLLAILLFSCEKQTPEPVLTLSEYIIGDWEVRESIDLVNFGDFEYHSIGPPYAGVFSFKEDQTYEIRINGNPGMSIPFSVNEQDSILILDTSPRQLYSFSEAVIDMRYQSGHGLAGHKLHKIE